MKRWFVVSFAVLALCASSSASADVIFSLDCQFLTQPSSPPAGPCTPRGPYGSVTLEDLGTGLGSGVKVTANLTVGYLPKVVSLNYYDPLQTTGWASDNGTLTVSFNDAGYYSQFDIRNVDSAPYANPFTFTLTNAALDLNPAYFLVRDQYGLYFSVVAATGDPGGEGNFYGSTARVPDPASTLLLLGTSLAGLAAFARRRRH